MNKSNLFKILSAIVMTLFLMTGVAIAEDALFIDENGKVGIGTSSPVGRLVVQALSDDTWILRLVTNDYDYGSTGSVVAFGFGNLAGNTYGNIQVGDEGGSSANNLILQPNGGNVGIGTTSPDELLHVENGSIKLRASTDGNNGLLRFYDSTDTEGGQVYAHSTDLRIYSANDIIFNQTGNVGIGTTNPDSSLTVYGSTAAGWNSGIELKREDGGNAWIAVDGQGLKFRTPINGDGFYFRDNDNVTSLFIQDGGNVAIGSTNTYGYKFYVGGSAYSTGGWLGSDKRWKKNIEPLENSLKKISQLQGVSYDWKINEYPELGFTEGDQIGLIAQDVEKIIPELVHTDDNGYKAISYEKLTPVLVEAVKELKAENDSLVEMIAKLEGRIAKLEQSK